MVRSALRLRAFALVFAFLAAGCGSESSAQPPLLEPFDGVSESLTKAAGGKNGDGDYCAAPANACLAGEGDCDADKECGIGLKCGTDNGPQFGMPEGHDVCVATHCTDGLVDADETGKDCGGECGACITCGGTNGDSSFCMAACKCSVGQGDCDGDFQCAAGLKCGTDNGPQFGMVEGTDVCVPLHCTNGVQDATETGKDCGGPDCGVCLSCAGRVAGSTDFCTAACPCASGQGDCDDNAQCLPGLACGTDNGPRFGLPDGFDVCVAASCTDGVMNGAETGVDCGGACGDCSSCTAPNGTPDTCSSTCRCGAGGGDCDSDAQCATGLKCGTDNGLRFGMPDGYDVCVPASCTDGVKDGTETGIDCGGACGACIACTAPNGTPETCSTLCPCTSSGGDCDSDAQCAAGLKCGTDNGPRFAMPAGFDVCVASHCTNGVKDADELSVDYGGADCGADEPPPVTTFSEPASCGGPSGCWVTLSCTDVGSGCAQTYYGVFNSAYKLYTEPFQVGWPATVCFYSMDAAGLAEPQRCVEYVADVTPPVTTASVPSGSFEEPFDVFFTCQDAGSGCAWTYFDVYELETGLSYPGATYAAFHVERDVSISFYSVDRAGQTEPYQQVTYRRAPQVLSALPAADSLAPGAAYLEVELSRLPVGCLTWCEDALTLTDDTYGAFVPGRFEWLGTRVRFFPAQPLTPGAIYHARVEADVFDFGNGLQLPADYGWSFVIADTTAFDVSAPTSVTRRTQGTTTDFQGQTVALWSAVTGAGAVAYAAVEPSPGYWTGPTPLFFVPGRTAPISVKAAPVNGGFFAAAALPGRGEGVFVDAWGRVTRRVPLWTGDRSADQFAVAGGSYDHWFAAIVEVDPATGILTARALDSNYGSQIGPTLTAPAGGRLAVAPSMYGFVAAWKDDGGALWAAFQDDPVGNWSQPLLLNVGSGSPTEPFDLDGVPFAEPVIAWAQEGAVWVAAGVGGSFGPPVAVSGACPAGDELAVATNGTLTGVIWSDGAYRVCGNGAFQGTWNTESVVFDGSYSTGWWTMAIRPSHLDLAAGPDELFAVGEGLNEADGAHHLWESKNSTPIPCVAPANRPFHPSLTTSIGQEIPSVEIACKCLSRSEGKSYPATPKPAPTI